MNKNPNAKVMHQRMSFLMPLPLGNTETQAFAMRYIKPLSEHDARALIHYIRVWASDSCWQIEDCGDDLAQHRDFLRLYGVWVEIDRIASQFHYQLKALQTEELIQMREDQHSALHSKVKAGDCVMAKDGIVIPARDDSYYMDGTPEIRLCEAGDVLYVHAINPDTLRLTVGHYTNNHKDRPFKFDVRPAQVELLVKCQTDGCAWSGRLFRAIHRGDLVLCPFCRNELVSNKDES